MISAARVTSWPARMRYALTMSHVRIAAVTPIRIACPVVVLLSLALSSAPAIAGPPAQPPVSAFPRAHTLRWQPQPQAVSYSIEIDCFGCCRTARWCGDVGAPYRIVTGLSRPEYHFQSTDPRPMRWRVWAVGADGHSRPKSPWWAVTAGS